MLDENNRQSYLKAMGVTEWKLRSGEDESIMSDEISLTAKIPAESLVDNQLQDSSNRRRTTYRIRNHRVQTGIHNVSVRL